MQTAERLFYNNGFHATSTDRICSDAGVSTRTLYRYFPTREVLTVCVLEARKKRFFAPLHPSHHPQAIAKLFSVMEEWMQQHGTGGCFFVKAWGEYAGRDLMLAAQALDYRYAARDYIVSCLRHSHGADSAALANAIWMLFEGATTAAMIIGPAAAASAGDAAQRLMKAGASL